MLHCTRLAKQGHAAWLFPYQFIPTDARPRRTPVKCGGRYLTLRSGAPLLPTKRSTIRAQSTPLTKGPPSDSLVFVTRPTFWLEQQLTALRHRTPRARHAVAAVEPQHASAHRHRHEAVMHRHHQRRHDRRGVAMGAECAERGVEHDCLAARPRGCIVRCYWVATICRLLSSVKRGVGAKMGPHQPCEFVRESAIANLISVRWARND